MKREVLKCWFLITSLLIFTSSCSRWSIDLEAQKGLSGKVEPLASGFSLLSALSITPAAISCGTTTGV